MRIAIAHEWLDQRAGSEKVFEAIAQCLGSADLYALTATPYLGLELDGREVTTTIADIRGVRDKRKLLLPLMPLLWRYATRREYDVVITSSHACVKGFRPGRRALHLCYCHTPMRYAWLPELDHRHRRGVFVRAAEAALRTWDRSSARWVDSFAVNSTTVRERVARCYGRDARVIHPPVDVEYFSPGDEHERDDYVLSVSRFIPYKRLDLAIQAAALAEQRLVVAGSGPQETALRHLAEAVHPGGVTFEIKPSQARLRDLYRRATAVLFPALEDFGLVPVEAQACGTPIVALSEGGALDSVISGTTGVLVNAQDGVVFAEGLKALLDAGDLRDACVRNASRFSVVRFQSEFTHWVSEETDSRQGSVTFG